MVMSAPLLGSKGGWSGGRSGKVGRERDGAEQQPPSFPAPCLLRILKELANPASKHATDHALCNVPKREREREIERGDKKTRKGRTALQPTQDPRRLHCPLPPESAEKPDQTEPQDFPPPLRKKWECEETGSCSCKIDSTVSSHIFWIGEFNRDFRIVECA